MSVVTQAAERIEAALKADAEVFGYRVYRDLSATVDPPGVMIGAPVLTWEGYCEGPPTSATFPVLVVGGADDRFMEKLWELVPAVAEVLDKNVANTAMTSANPTPFTNGATQLPAYELTCEVSLMEGAS